MWDAKKWSPSAIINGTELFDRISRAKPNEDSIPYPFEGLTKMTRGIRTGEISLFAAGSGVGKSQVCRQIAHHILTTTECKVGYIALEESIERSGQGILGIELKKQLHLEPFEVDEKFTEGYQKTIGSGRFFLYDHWGSMNTNELLSHIRFMVQAEGVSHIVLDHISIIVSGLSEGETSERKSLDILMTRLRALVEESKFSLILVSHLKRPEGNRGFEDGLAPNLSSLRGSASLSQLADQVIGLSRNLQSDEDKHTTTVTVLKNRFSGNRYCYLPRIQSR